MLTHLTKAPWPQFGGKRDAAPTVWNALGDPDHYCEPFAGSAAVLLERPHPCNRSYHSETINDVDGLIANLHRCLAYYPQETAEAASWPVVEADMHARHLSLLRWITDRNVERLMADPLYCDPQVGGWYAWGLSSWIGSGWCSGDGPWVVDTVSGRLVKRRGDGGVRRKLPHVSGNGQGANRHTLREPGVSRKLPHVSDNGRGVQHSGTREPGVAGMPDTGTALDNYRALIEADYVATGGFHPMTMPELRRWFDFLSARLRHVRVLNGDYRRLLTIGALCNLPVRQGGICGLFIDPPYSSDERDPRLYRKDNTTGESIAADVRAWCLAHGDNPQLRIVLAGYAGEGHEVLEAHGWTVREWFKAGFLKGGMGLQGGSENHQQHRERLWCSPACIPLDDHSPRQMQLW